MKWTPWLLAAGSIAAGTFLSEFIDELVGLEAAAATLAEWWRQNLPVIRFVPSEGRVMAG